MALEPVTDGSGARDRWPWSRWRLVPKQVMPGSRGSAHPHLVGAPRARCPGPGASGEGSTALRAPRRFGLRVVIYFIVFLRKQGGKSLVVMVLCSLQSLSTKPSCSSALGPVSSYYSRAHLRTLKSYSGNTGKCKNLHISSGRCF